MHTEQILQSHIWPTARLFADRYHMLTYIASRTIVASVAEIGVANGQFSRFLLDACSPSYFAAYDIFELHKLDSIWGTPSVEMFSGKTHYDFYCDHFATDISSGRVAVFSGDSSPMLRSSSRDFDLIYIDGDHSLEGVKLDVEAALCKIKPTGVLVFNDYIAYDHFGMGPYGIVDNVNSLLGQSDWKIMSFAFQRHMFCDIALTRTSSPWLEPLCSAQAGVAVL